MPKPGTPQESPIGASAKAKTTLARIASELGISRIDLLDQAVDALAAYYEHHGKRLLLPLRFTETFQVAKIDPSGLLILEEPRAKSELDDVAGGRRTKTATHQRAAAG